MKKKLSFDYDISAKNMLDFTKDQEIADFKINVAEFFSDKGKNIKRTVLARDGEQIYHMTDGIYILEREDEDGEYVDYYYSENIKDLIK
jgi:hypothetical protein